MGLTAKKKAPTGKGGGGAAGVDASVAAIYDQLTGQLSSGAGVTGANFDRARQLVGSAFDQQGQLMRDAASATMGGLNGQFDRLGIGDATDSATQGLRNQFSQSLISASRRRANELSGMAQQQAGYDVAGRMGIDNSRREGAQQRTESVIRVQEALAAMEAAKAQAQGQVDLASVQGQSELEQLRLQMRMAEQEASQGDPQDPLDPLRAEGIGLENLIKQAKLDEILNGDGGSDKISGEGQAALEQFLAQNAGGVSPRLLNRFNSLKDNAFVAAGKPSDLGYKQDPYDLAMSALMSNPNYGGSESSRRKLEQMLQLYFG